MRWLQIDEATGLITSIADFPAFQRPVGSLGSVWLEDDPAEPADHRQHAYQRLEGDWRRIPRPAAHQAEVERERALAQARIDRLAAQMMDALRPAAAARLDAERVRQAELALASADEYCDAFALLGGTGLLDERARAVLTAAQATADRLVRIDVARRDAKARIRAATTPADIAAVTLDIPE